MVAKIRSTNSKKTIKNPTKTSGRKTITTIRKMSNMPSTTRAKTSQLAIGAAGASKPPKTVARPSGGTKTGGGKAAGGKRGC
jgi:hypothetical protein